MYRLLGNLFALALSLALFRFATPCMLMSSNKNETAVHGCNPAILVLVVLVSHKVYFLCSTISLAVLFDTLCRNNFEHNTIGGASSIMSA